MLRKLGVDDRTQAAVLALRRGWVRLEDTSRQLLIRHDNSANADTGDAESNQ